MKAVAIRGDGFSFFTLAPANFHDGKMMNTLNRALDALEKHCGFDRQRAAAMALRMQEASVLPMGGPGRAPLIDDGNFVDLFIAVAADRTHREAAAAARTYGAMTPGGTNLDGAPASIPTARMQLIAMAQMAIEDNSGDVRDARIDVVSNFPEILVTWAEGEPNRFQPVGALREHWQTTKIRKSTTVAGAAFADAGRAVFGGAHG